MFTFAELRPGTVKKRQPEGGTISGRFKIQKADDDKRLAFGWASASANIKGEVVEDSYGDIIDIDELEQAAYKFVELYREGGEMHQRGGCGVLVESVIFTPEKMAAMGIPEGTVPAGWWIGFRVTDATSGRKSKTAPIPCSASRGRPSACRRTRRTRPRAVDESPRS